MSWQLFESTRSLNQYRNGVGADSLVGSESTCSAVAHRASRVRVPARGPFPIPSPLSLSNLISCLITVLSNKKKTHTQEGLNSLSTEVLDQSLIQNIPSQYSTPLLRAVTLPVHQKLETPNTMSNVQKLSHCVQWSTIHYIGGGEEEPTGFRGD